MPVYLDETELASELDGIKSVLIVPCRFCPAVSTAVRSDEPLIALFRHCLKTAPYERLIKHMKRNLEDQGVKVGIFKSNLLHQFVLCMWTSKRRKKLAERAKDYDALVVLGCEAVAQMVRNAVQSTQCRVVQGMTSKGIMGVKPGISLPCNISIELESVTPMN